MGVQQCNRAQLYALPLCVCVTMCVVTVAWKILKVLVFTYVGVSVDFDWALCLLMIDVVVHFDLLFLRCWWCWISPCPSLIFVVVWFYILFWCFCGSMPLAMVAGVVICGWWCMVVMDSWCCYAWRVVKAFLGFGSRLIIWIFDFGFPY